MHRVRFPERPCAFTAADVNDDRITINVSRDHFSFEDLVLKSASLHDVPISAGSFELTLTSNLQLGIRGFEPQMGASPTLAEGVNWAEPGKGDWQRSPALLSTEAWWKGKRFGAPASPLNDPPESAVTRVDVHSRSGSESTKCNGVASREVLPLPISGSLERSH